jgi:hypothetical protein
MRVTNSQDIHINDYLRDGVLLKVTDSNPLYANIVNYMVTGYILPGGTRKSWYTKARNICGMIPMYIDCVVMVYFEDVCPLSKDFKMSCGTIWRTLWCFPHTCKKLVQ